MDFVCKSLKTAIDSLSTWFHIESAVLVKMLHHNYFQKFESSGASREVPFSTYLCQQMPLKPDLAESLPRVHWFHGTRCIDPKDLEKGLLPLNSIMPTLQKSLDDIAREHVIPRTKMTTDHGNHSAFLINTKLKSQSDLGPCAMLNYEALISPSAFDCYPYTGMPEFVEDYANLWYGDHANEVLDHYRNASKPAIVEFWSIPNDPVNPQMDHIVEVVLMYAYAKIHPKQELLGSMCNTCYSGYGIPVLPKMIVSVTLLEK